jgi:hypothetical protein
MKMMLVVFFALFSVVSAEEQSVPFENPKWKAAYEHNMNICADRYRQYFYRNDFWAVMRQWNAWAKINRPDIWRDPRKCLFYCQWWAENDTKEAGKAQHAKQTRLRDEAAVNAAASDYFERHAARKKAELEGASRRSDSDRVIEKLDQMERQRQLDESNRRLQDFMNQ